MNRITTGRSFFSMLTLVALAIVAPVAMAQTSAKGEDVVIKSVQGDVRVTVRGTERPARKDGVLELPAKVRTGASSSIELRQGRTSVDAAANTSLNIKI